VIWSKKGTLTGRTKCSVPNLAHLERRLVAGFGDEWPAKLRELADVGDVDVHVRTAALVYEVPEDQVTPEMRAHAKIINFGVIYGPGGLIGPEWREIARTPRFGDCIGMVSPPLGDLRDSGPRSFKSEPGQPIAPELAPEDVPEDGSSEDVPEDGSSEDVPEAANNRRR
jgi:hypothetical protein